jgi:hypothetical protein
LLLAGLTVCVSSARAGIWTEPDSFDVGITEGCKATEVLTIGNDGDGVLNFTLLSRETSREISEELSGGGAGVSMVKADEGRIILEYRFGRPVVSEGGEYDTVQIKGLETYQRTGAPIVPVRPATILVPFGKKVLQTRVIPLDTWELPGTYQLQPAQRPYTLNYDGQTARTEPNPAIYNQATPWPGMNNEQTAVYSKRGYQLFVLNLFPVQYVPATGRITYTTKMRVEIELADSFETNVLRPSETTKSALKRRVDNPSVLDSYDAETGSVKKLGGVSALPGGGPYEYVIITNQTLEGASGPWNFQALRDAKIARGVTATIVTTEWIYANYDGSKPSGGMDNQTRIRNFLIDAYQTWGTQFVLLGGTNAIVPARLFWVDSLASETGYMPVDMYYGCVEPAACTFDFDADNNYGEPTDGVGGGDVDLYAEIFVGRAAVQDASELANFIRKTLAYSSTYSDYLPRISMVGEYLGFGGVSDYATESMEQIRLGGTYDGYFTYGFENHTRPDFYDFNTSTNLYDAPGYDWPKSELIGLMNQGVHIFNHLGHADYTYNMKLYTSDLPSLSNDDYFFAYSQGCMPGGFDTTDCFAEVLTTMEHGAFAAVMNARYGWGTLDSTDGPSQRFARQFWDAALGEDKLEIGKANQDSKEDNLWDINGSCIRWCYYELTLFGDPQQEFRFEEFCEWITIDPNEGTIGPGESSEVNVTFDAMDLSPGAYEAEIIISSNDPCGSAVVSVTMTVSADALEVSPAGGFTSSGTKGGPFGPEKIVYHLTNTGSESINWTTLLTEDWLTITPQTGVLGPGASIDVNVCINAIANLLEPNVYSEVLTFENLDSGSIKRRSIVLTVNPPDLFTESFDAGGDFAGMSLTFLPNGSVGCYEACRDEVSEFPTDPNGGTYLSLGDDDFTQVVLADGKEVLFYGQSYDRFYVGSNGYITFGAGDTEFDGSLENHFYLPRISGYFTDLMPATLQDVSFRQLEDRVTVTFKDVPIFGDKTAKNSFQIEMFFGDGAIRITWLKLAAVAGVAGLSEGYGLPPELFEESDFRGYPICWPLGDFDKDYDVDLTDLGIFVSYWLNADCNYPMWCDRTDLDFSSVVEGVDFSIFAWNWGVVKSTMPSPLAYWKFDEGAGDIVYDSASDNDGTLRGAPDWVSGIIGDYALDFNGVHDRIVIEGSAGYDSPLNIYNSDLTISAWVKPRGTGTRSIVCRAKSLYITYHLRIESTNRVSINTYKQGPGHWLLTTEEALTENNWYHIVGVFDRTEDQGHIYINGINKAEGAMTTDPLSNDATTKIGCVHEETSDSYYFNGTIDDLRIYNQAFSAAEVWQLYREGLSHKATNPNPADGETGVDPNVVLSWFPGKDALTHDIYFGMDFNEVNDADIYDPNIYMGNQDVNYWDVNNYDANGLESDTTFYWRIDEVSAAITTKGDVWSFTTVSESEVNLVSWWKVDEGQGNIAYDSAGTNNGTVYGATWTTGKIDGALSFDGVNDYVDCGSGPSNYDNITVSAWMKTSTEGTLVSNRDAGGSYGTWYTLFSTNVELGDNSQGGYRRSYFNTPTIDDIWHHIVYTKDGINHAIYVDGSLDHSFTSNADISQVNPMFIGRRWNRSNSPYWFNGTIDDVRIYDRALSAAEVWRLYQSGL